MTEWSVFLVIVALFSFGVAVITPALKLNTSITKLVVCVDVLNDQVKELAKKNSESHKNIYDKIEEHDKRIDKHDIELVELKDVYFQNHVKRGTNIEKSG